MVDSFAAFISLVTLRGISRLHGDLVLLKDDNAPRNSWSMGIVRETEEDSEGYVRSVKIKTQSTELRRPVNKLVLLLPTEDSSEVNSTSVV